MNRGAYLRSLIVSVLYPLVVAVFALLVVALGVLPQMKQLQNWMIATWARFSLWLYGVELRVLGLEHFPQGPYVALFNHTSNFDILAIQALIPSIRFGAKIELFRIPLFGQALRASGALPIARSQPSEVIKIYNEAKARFLAGECFALAPEGTRQHEEILGSFKAGPFLFAIAGQVPIVPIALKGASLIQPKTTLLPNTQFWKSVIEVQVGVPIPTTGMASEHKETLQNQARQAFYSLGLR